MSSVPDSARHIIEGDREDELTQSEQYLYDQFARAWIETRNKKTAALSIGFNIFVAHDAGNKMYDSGFTQRRIAWLLAAPLSDEEIEHKTNKSFRVLAQMTENPDPKVAVAAAVNIHKIQSERLERKRLSGPDDDRASGGVMVIPSGPDTLDGWGEAAEKSQAALQKQITDYNAEHRND